jgi:hypothetical protein
MGKQLEDVVFVLKIVLTSDEFDVTEGVFALDHEILWIYTIGVFVIKGFIADDTITDDRVITCFIYVAEATTIGAEYKFLSIIGV